MLTFVIGEQKFGLRLPGEFNREDVRKAVNLAHEHDKKYMWQLMVFFIIII